MKKRLGKEREAGREEGGDKETLKGRRKKNMRDEVRRKEGRS